MAVIKDSVKKPRKPKPRTSLSGGNQARDQRYELFCWGIVKGLSQADAYRNAGYSRSGKKPSMRHLTVLMKKPAIIRRIEELRANMRYKLKISVESLVVDLVDSRQRAIKAGEIGNEINATMAIARLLGFLVEKNELVLAIAKPLPVPTKELDLSIEEWQKRWAPKELPSPNGHDKKNGGEN